MQRLALVGVRRRDGFVELDAEARRAWRDHVAVFPDDRCLENFGVEAAPDLDALQDQDRTRP